MVSRKFQTVPGWRPPVVSYVADFRRGRIARPLDDAQKVNFLQLHITNMSEAADLRL
jgi:hypothetical protein